MRPPLKLGTDDAGGGPAAGDPGDEDRSAASQRSLRRQWSPLQQGDDRSSGPLAWLAGAGAVVALFAWLWALTHHVNASLVNSDAATVVLEADSLLHGNLLLHGWWLSLDSWWTLDASLFALVMAVTGAHPFLLLAMPAAVVTSVVVLGVLLARRGLRGPAAWVGGAVVVVVLALPGHALATQLLANPWHQTTILCALLAFVALRRGRFGPGWMAAVVLLSIGMLGDLMTLAYATIPIALGGLVAMLRRRSARAGAAPVAAAAFATVLAYVVRVVAAAAGAFLLGPTNPHAGVSQALQNLHEAVTLGIPGLFGVRHVHGLGPGGVGTVVRAFHLVGLLVVFAGFVWALWSLAYGAVAGRVPQDDGPGRSQPAGGEAWRLDDVLVIAAFGSASTYVLLALTQSPSYFRYLTATVVFSTVVAARMVSRWWAAPRASSWRRSPVTVGAVAVGAVMVAAALAGVGRQLANPAPPKPETALTAFLAGHHLRSGVGDYWSSAITTVDTRGAIVVRPVVAGPHDVLEGYDKGDVHAWFDGVAFQFLVFEGSGGFGGVNATSAERTWGPPAHVYDVDQGAYTVLTWSRPIRVTRIEPRLAPN